MAASKILEINLISAQDLKPPSTANPRGLQTYAVVWVDPTNKLRTRIDRAGGDNPTWNDKFLFKVSQEFLAGETSGVSFEIYAVGRLRNPLIGSARFLISNLHPGAGGPAFFPLHIQRPCGRFHGVLNIGATAGDGSASDLMRGSSAVGYRDLMGQRIKKAPKPKAAGKKKGKGGPGGVVSAAEKENSVDIGDMSGELSDGGGSTTSSSSSSSTVLKDWNKLNRSFSLSRSASEGGILCGLGLNMQRRFSLCLSTTSSFSASR